MAQCSASTCADVEMGEMPSRSFLLYKINFAEIGGEIDPGCGSEEGLGSIGLMLTVSAIALVSGHLFEKILLVTLSLFSSSFLICLSLPCLVIYPIRQLS